ncbi:MAG TPA: hypothetical protein VGJ92_08805 [Methanocella sp.]|jgi:phage shock protein A
MAEARINMLIDRVESLDEMLDYSYRWQLELSQRVKNGIAGVIVPRKRLELCGTTSRQSGSTGRL